MKGYIFGFLSAKVIDSSSFTAGILSERVHALQAYGDSVLDEAPLLAITNYDATIFMRRGEIVQDKHLYASEPVCFDDTHPSTRGSWLYGLQQAQELRSLKQVLLRADVPPTQKGNIIQAHPQHSYTLRQQAAADQQPAAEEQAVAELQAARAGSKRLRFVEPQAAQAGSAAGRRWLLAAEPQAAQAGSTGRQVRPRNTCVMLRLQASHHSGKGYEKLPSRSTAAQPPAPPQPPAAHLTDPAAEETVLLSELSFGSLVGSGHYANTYEVSLCASHRPAPMLRLLHPAHSLCP